MALYEHVFIARQDVSTSQVEQLAEHFGKILEEGGGKVTKTEQWGLKALSHRIKKNRKGHYVLLNIDAPSPAVAEMERQMQLHDDVIRHLTIRVTELEEGPSAMMQSRGRDGDRRRRRDDDDRPERGDRGGFGGDRGDRGDRGGFGGGDRGERRPRRED